MANPANLNAAKHLATSAVARRGELPKGFEHLQETVDHFYEGWISDLGGPENITQAKEALLFTARACLVVILLGLEHLKAQGLTDMEGNPQPILKILGSYMNTLRLNLVAVGLEREAKDVTPNLDAYLRQRGAG